MLCSRLKHRADGGWGSACIILLLYLESQVAQEIIGF